MYNDELESVMMGDYHVTFGGRRAKAILPRPTQLFFMVNFMQNLSLFSVTSPSCSALGGSGKNYHTNVEIGKGNNQKDPLDSKYDYTKVTVEDPYYNRDIIARVAKKQKGVYV